MLVVTARRPLEARFGFEGYRRIRSTLESWSRVDEGRVVAIDDPDEMRPMGLNARGNDQYGIQRAIRDIARSYPSLVDSVLLAGGDAVLPFFQMDNVVADRSIDPDPLVRSDNPYGALSDTADEWLAPSRPVGRLAVSDSATVDDFASIIERTPHRAKPASVGLRGTALVVNQDWTEYSRRVAQAMPAPLVWHVSPGYQMNEATRDDAARSTLFFNLHGFRDDPDWKCYSLVQRAFVPAVTPGALDRSCVTGAVAFAECCYGAEIVGRSAGDSCALKLVQEGAAFVGATGLAFGSYLASDVFLEDADFLARAFFQALGMGEPIGSALRIARKVYLEDATEARSGCVWQYKQKTLLQFVLFGNPQTRH
jgi:hypothetical protein